jgi:hypothetical protein
VCARKWGRGAARRGPVAGRPGSDSPPPCAPSCRASPCSSRPSVGAQGWCVVGRREGVRGWRLREGQRGGRARSGACARAAVGARGGAVRAGRRALGAQLTSALRDFLPGFAMYSTSVCGAQGWCVVGGREGVRGWRLSRGKRGSGRARVRVRAWQRGGRGTGRRGAVAGRPGRDSPPRCAPSRRASPCAPHLSPRTSGRRGTWRWTCGDLRAPCRRAARARAARARRPGCSSARGSPAWAATAAAASSAPGRPCACAPARPRVRPLLVLGALKCCASVSGRGRGRLAR